MIERRVFMVGFSDRGERMELVKGILWNGDQAGSNNDKENRFGQPKSRFRSCAGVFQPACPSYTDDPVNFIPTR